MKMLNLMSGLILLGAAGAAQAQRGTLVFPPRTPPQVPLPAVWVDPNYQPPDWSGSRVPSSTAGQVFVYDQKPYGGHAPLIAPQQAQDIIDRFKAAYPKLGNPRFLIYVNRDLVNLASRPTVSQQHIESTKNFGNGSAGDAGSIKTTTEQGFHTAETSPPTLADRQTMRDVERLFGRPLRQAGASLVDQKVAADLIADKPIAEFIATTDSPESRKDREAIGRIADVVIEVLISSKNVMTTSLSDPQMLTIPDIQATAISLKESKIIGQAASADVTARVAPSALGSYGVPEITDATALVLMEDITTEAK
jgi:hypothetical protein